MRWPQLRNYTWVILSLFTLVVWNILRFILIAMSGLENVDLSALAGILLRGLWFDSQVLLLFWLPYLIFKLFLPNSAVQSRIFKKALPAFVFSWVFLSYFFAASEIVFWHEFTSRFNFIAVDYLVYTQEVLGNINQSYPMVPIMLGLFTLSCLTTVVVLRRYPAQPFEMTRRRRLSFAAVLLVAIPLSIEIHSLDQFEFSNSYETEISNNGIYSLFAAYRRNELQYSKFYKTIPQKEADSILKSLGVEREPASEFDGKFTYHPDEHEANEMGPFKRTPKNVILITVESLSAEFLGTFGNKNNLTPNLDRLTKQGYSFTELFATGTRTVRGLEALSLGIPPVPGQAVVRRPNNAKLDTLGEVIRNQNVNTYFFYGGYGYFDNMNDYFLNNNYEVIDRKGFDQKSITFENVWGVADEILFSNALNILSKKATSGARFFAQIMTTSNHRPYTYPDGRIDIKSPGGRDGAVKYTDYAIGKFIQDAESKPWFKDTLFVIVADHCASVAGKMKLPVANYRIPLILYGPDLVTPGTYTRTASQIDLAPTLVDVLKLHGDDLFFGESLFENSEKPGRAFVSNYQELGYYKNNILTVLKPKQKVEAFKVDLNSFKETPTDVDAQLANEAVSYYQTADLSLRDGALKYHDSEVQNH